MAKTLPTGTKEATSQKKLRQLLSACRSAQGNIDELADGLRTEISNAVEKHFLHRRAFNMIKALDKLSPEQLAVWSDNFEHYMEISGLNERIKSAPSLALGGTGEEGDHNEAEADEREQERALAAAKNGAANGGGTDKKKPAAEVGGAKEGNVENFPTPQGRA